jgi:hypothetical protein
MTLRIKRDVFKQFPTCSKMTTTYSPDCTSIACSKHQGTARGTYKLTVDLPGRMEGVVGLEGQEKLK